MTSLLALQTYQEVAADPAPSRVLSIWDQMGGALHNSIYRVLSFFISLLPGLLALVLAIAIITANGSSIMATNNTSSSYASYNTAY